jgi:hypothetical protein
MEAVPECACEKAIVPSHDRQCSEAEKGLNEGPLK